ncbi:MAG: murein biosynthesis integral membrane protein MurJ [Candidatus Rokuibacteriota bacterium]
MSVPPNPEGQVMRALGTIGSATLVSRVLGFARDMVIALVFGAGTTTDAFLVALRIPNIMRRLLGEGALSAAVIPVITEYAFHRSRVEMLRTLRALLGATLLVLTAVTILGMAAAPELVRFLAPGFTREPGQAALSASLTRVMFPYLALVALSALAMGTLHAHARFLAPALGPAVQNVAIIVCVALLASRLNPAILAPAIGVVLGGLGQLVVQLPSLNRCGCLVAPSGEIGHPAVRQVGRLLLPAVVGLASVQVNVFVNTLLASLLPAGSISFLYYADRVMELPLGVFGIALASAALPTMSRQASVRDIGGLAGTLSFGLRWSFFIAVPATLGLIVLRTPITRVLFERGQFTAADTLATAEALKWFALGLAGMSAARIAAQVFYALQEPMVAVRLGVVSVLVNIAAACVLMGPLQHAGLAAAASLASYVNLGTLMWVARRRLGPIGGIAILGAIARTATASAPLLLVCLASLWLWPPSPADMVDAIWLLSTIVLAGLAFGGSAWCLRAPELPTIARSLLRRRNV